MTAAPERQYYIDWLRLMAVFLLFFFHTACVFHPWSNFYIKNDISSPIITYIFVWAVGHWYMSLFFLLAGSSTYYALQKRSGVEFSRERLKRLFIPLIFGTLILVPPISYLGLLNHSDYSQSFLTWLPNFFHMQTADLDGYFLGGFTPGHLWFILHLLIYSLISLPLFLYFNRESGQKWIKRTTSILINPVVLFLLFPALLIPISKFPWIAGGNPLFYITFFIMGFIIMSDKRFIYKIDGYRHILLILGIVPLAIFIFMDGMDYWPADTPVWFEGVIREYRNAFVPWFFILALMAYGRRFLNFSNRFLKYFAEGSYPIYILHQTAIVVIAFFVVQWDLEAGAKYFIIVALAFLVVIIAYDIFIRRTNITRFLFGMKLHQKKLS